MKLVDVFVTPFDLETQDGGGFGTRCILRSFSVKKFYIRSSAYLVKLLNQVIGGVIFPFLHPVFTRYLPLGLLGRSTGTGVFNFSQTFAGVFFVRRGVVVCHDLQCHRNFLFNRWARSSEMFLLNKATEVLVVSERDATIVRRFYKVPAAKVNNVSYALCENIKPFKREVPCNVSDVLFIGSMNRSENRDAVVWFAERVLPKLPNLNLHVVGSTSDDMVSMYPYIKWHGFVEDLDEFVKPFQLMIAPMLSSAGIKIKVIYALEKGIPVLGTREAYSGLQQKNKKFRTNEVDIWYDVLTQGGLYEFSSPPKCCC